MPVENVQVVNASGDSLSGRLQLQASGAPRASHVTHLFEVYRHEIETAGEATVVVVETGKRPPTGDS